jgi:hypothetical protein
MNRGQASDSRGAACLAGSGPRYNEGCGRVTAPRRRLRRVHCRDTRDALSMESAVIFQDSVALARL